MRKAKTTNRKSMDHSMLSSAAVSIFTLVPAFILWNIDNNYCTQLYHVRKHYLDPFLGFLTQLHAWWHLLTLVTSIYAVKSIERYCENSESDSTTIGISSEEEDEHTAFLPPKDE